jgi:hypothetical protein
MRTGRLIVKRTGVLQPSPDMEPRRRQLHEPQDRGQRHERTRTLDGSQDPDFRASVG